MSEALAVPQSVLEAASAAVTETSLTLSDPDLDWETYERLGAFLGNMNRACAWWIGDVLIQGEHLFGHKYSQIESVIGLAPQTLANRASVARHIPPNRRRAALPFGVHAEVAYLEPRERDLWLDKAERGQWTRAKLRQEMRDARGIAPAQMGDLAVTGKMEDSPHAELLEERSDNGVPAAVGAHGTLLGEPVSRAGVLTCPNCGYLLHEKEDLVYDVEN